MLRFFRDAKEHSLTVTRGFISYRDAAPLLDTRVKSSYDPTKTAVEETKRLYKPVQPDESNKIHVLILIV